MEINTSHNIYAIIVCSYTLMKIKQSHRTNVVMNYTETEAKVREATNDDAWGPTGINA